MPSLIGDFQNFGFEQRNVIFFFFFSEISLTLSPSLSSERRWCAPGC